ncbi:hypothetical protein L1887_06804 [Cichorium endivia]|nr:hypothetical protein L1887_06804 [Cichorium endivia]
MMSSTQVSLKNRWKAQHLYLYIQDGQRVDVDHQKLYEYTLAGSWEAIDVMVTIHNAKVTDKVTNNGNTALHVAVATAKPLDFLEKMLELMKSDNIDVLILKNSDGSTLLHVAATVGNTEAAKIMMTEYPKLLLVEDKDGRTPLAIALSNMHTETVDIMMKQIETNEEISNALFSGTRGDELLVTVISSGDFSFANSLLERYEKLSSDAVLMALAQNFPCKLNIPETYSAIYVEQIVAIKKTIEDLRSPVNDVPFSWSWVRKILNFFFSGIYEIIIFFLQILRMLVLWPLVKERVRIHKNAVALLTEVCALIKKSDPFSHHCCYNNSILEATKQNAYEVVFHIVISFPDAIWSANEDGLTFIQLAVISRSEEVYNLLYQMSEQKNVYRTIKDVNGNNLLHLAARLAPINKLNLISGAALQIQREIQWFKEVEEFVCPINIIEKNSSNETPQMIFTREHKELVDEGEKWMKAAAKSYTITAALIITIVFAAAITVPGGNNQGTDENNQHKAGLPVFTNSKAFNTFAISDAISLFAAVTSLLVFLSILTTRFAERDFLYKLPTKLIIGLATLFISTTAMVVAFGATLYLVFGRSNSRILITIAVLTCIPITSFVILQLRLIKDLISATYGRSIFGKKRDDPFY